MKIQDKQRASLHSSLNNIISLTQDTHKYSLPVDEAMRLYWSDEEVAAIKRTQHMVDPIHFRSKPATFTSAVTMPHPVFPDLDIAVSLQFRTHVPNGSLMLLPVNTETFHHDAPIEVIDKLNTMTKDIATEALDRAILQDTLSFLIDRCNTFEQLRYNFPPMLMLMDRIGMGHIAAQVEHIKRPPPPVAMSGKTRAKLRYMLNWFAVQQLLGTFENTHTAAPRNHMVVTLNGNHEFMFEEHHVFFKP